MLGFAVAALALTGAGLAAFIALVEVGFTSTFAGACGVGEVGLGSGSGWEAAVVVPEAAVEEDP